MNLHTLNTLGCEQAHEVFFNCCSAERWTQLMIDSRPFSNQADMLQHAKNHWAAMQESDWLEAFAGHPKIGDVNSLKEKYAATRGLAGHEQSSVSEADDLVIEKLAHHNAEYEKIHGFIFIVFATGKSAEQMLALLMDRIHNTRLQELHNAAAEQLKITLLRLDKIQ